MNGGQKAKIHLVTLDLVMLTVMTFPMWLTTKLMTAMMEDLILLKRLRQQNK